MSFKHCKKNYLLKIDREKWAFIEQVTESQLKIKMKVAFF